uniref:Uncharacterized protein n=1 Tax=Arundo donax TaxID=35708 RepID=A0A0A8YSJ6_ARUDO
MVVELCVCWIREWGSGGPDVKLDGGEVMVARWLGSSERRPLPALRLGGVA